MTDPSTRFVGDIPIHYDEGLGPHLFEDYAKDIAKRAKAREPNNVLELAAGTGIASKALRSELTEKTHLVVTDLNEPMLDIARQKFGSDTSVKFQSADAMKLPIANDEFDLIVCQFGVMFFPDKQAAFRQSWRVLSDGGRFLFNVWAPISANPVSQVAFNAGAKFFPDNPPLFYQTPFSYHDPKNIAEDLRQAGFTEITHEVVQLEKEVRDWSLLARGLVFGNPFIEEINSREGVMPEEVMKAVEAALRTKFGETPTTMLLEAIVFEARKNNQQ